MHRISRTLWLVVAALSLGSGVVFAGGLGSGTQHLVPVSGEELARDTEVYRQHETVIANPFMEGRAPGTKGNRIVADYIEWNYKQLGLKPAFPAEAKGKDGESGAAFASYRQVFKAPASKRPGDSLKVTKQTASYSVKGGATGLRAGQGFNVVGYSGSGEVTGEIVFAGYGVNISEHKYETYPEGTDLTDKVVMIMRFEPIDEKGKSRWAAEGRTWSEAAGLEGKLNAAVKRHAAAVILVAPPGADDPRVAELGDLSMGGGKRYDIPVVMMSQEAADQLVRRADGEGRSLEELRKRADKAGGLVEFSNGAVFKIATKIEKVDLMTDNVGAVLVGKGKLAEEYIVIGSHYDHVGYGYFGSRKGEEGKIHPGADDNASGTAANLLAAKTLSEAYAELPKDAEARSVLFLCFSAEESGLIGSAFYAKNPIAAVDKHYLMLNMDMVGRLRDGKLEVGGVGTGAGLTEWARPYWDKSGMTVKVMALGPTNSDHASFYNVKIPDLFFFSGYHGEYHTPKDTVDLINFEGGAQIADLVARMTFDAARRTEPMPFLSGRDEDEKPDNPHAGAANGDAGALTGVKVRFGIMPDYSFDAKPGVMISNLSSDKGLSAEKAGLKEGDLMTKWDDNTFAGVEEWMGVMGKYKPGDKVTVTFIRDGKEQTTVATLTAAGAPKEPKN